MLLINCSMYYVRYSTNGWDFSFRWFHSSVVWLQPRKFLNVSPHFSLYSVCYDKSLAIQEAFHRSLKELAQLYLLCPQQEAGQVHPGASAGVWRALYRVRGDAAHFQGCRLGSPDVLRALLQLLPGQTVMGKLVRPRMAQGHTLLMGFDQGTMGQSYSF